MNFILEKALIRVLRDKINERYGLAKLIRRFLCMNEKEKNEYLAIFEAEAKDHEAERKKYQEEKIKPFDEKYYKDPMDNIKKLLE